MNVHSRRIVPVLLALSLGVLGACATTVTEPAPTAAAATADDTPGADDGADVCEASDPFTADDVVALDARYAGRHLAVAVADAATGCTYRYGSSEWFPTASTAKLEIMGAVFLALQDQGATSLPAWMTPVVQAMIQWSDNDAADQLYDWLGGGAALQLYGRRLGMTTTDNTSHDWGGTATTPDDQLPLLQTVVVGGGVLSSRWVTLARSFLASVDSSQRWGVTAGVPAGSTVWLKNGWYYNDGSLWGPGAGWRLGSIGVVQLANARRYSIAVYVDDDPSYTSGVATIEQLAAHVAATMATTTLPAATAAIVDTPAVTTAFTPASPTRLLDTRTDGARVGGDAVAVVTVPTPAGGDAIAAVALEVTAVDPLADGYVTVYADGSGRPLASDLNPLRGRITANLVITPVGADGRVQLFSSAPVHLVVDLVGTFAAVDGPVAAGRLVTVEPVRVLDTRTTAVGGVVGAGSVTRVAVTGQGAVPVDGVAAVAVTVTATDVTARGVWTVWPGGGALPLASVLNTAPGDTVGNTTLVPVAADGTVSVFSQSGGALVVDVVGWVTDATAAPATVGRIAVASEPVRIVDTRIGLGGNRLAADDVHTFATGLGAGVAGLLADMVTVDPDAAGFLTVYGADADRPATSTTNPTPGRDPAAVAVATALTAGRFSVYSKAGVDLVVDIWGWLTG